MNKNILITGGAGFIGGHLTDYLISKNYKVTVIDNFSNGHYKNPKAKYVDLDVKDIKEDNLINPYSGEIIDTVYHLAGILDVETSKRIPKIYINQNSTLTYNLLDLCSKLKIRKFIYASSCACIHPNSSPYALSKYIPELFCKTYNNLYDIDTTSLRFFNVYGDRMNHSGYRLVLSIFKEQYDNKQPLTVYNNGKQLRDYIHVDDVVSALYKSKNITTNAEVLDVGSGKASSILDIVNMFGSECKFIGERSEITNTMSNIEKTKKILGWEPQHKLKDFIECLKN